ncbi:MAG: type II toxin-antitoxin system RelE/ParE family toxin [Candidatus Shapirobacteria bacterium]|nr:type II toxin-antitoxin system RelE/ParE family toxin [Candidatus Shapirobacteria bacterium]
METFFINPDLREYIYSLDKATLSKFIRLSDLLETYGEKLGMPYSKKIQKNLYELRIHGQREIRVFYCFYRDKTVFVHAIIKKSRKTPTQDIKTAMIRIKQLTNI